jgi:hypothetical protein
MAVDVAAKSRDPLKTTMRAYQRRPAGAGDSVVWLLKRNIDGNVEL